MKIGIISDTRVTKGDQIPPEVFRAFDGVDLIPVSYTHLTLPTILLV